MGGGVCQLANFSTFQLFDLLGSRKVGDLETWRGKASTQEGVRKCCRVWDVWPRYAVGCPPPPLVLVGGGAGFGLPAG